MFRKSLLVILLLGTAVMTYAQEKAAADTTEGWKTKGNFNVNFSLVQLENWAGGGENSMSLGSRFSFFADYKKGRSTWNNFLDIAYGQAKIGDQNFRKTDDQLIIVSKYGYKLKKKWFISAAADFRTQLANGFNYTTVNDTLRKNLISKFMSPGFLLATVGVEYRPNDNFFASLSPVSSKTTFVLADNIDETKYGLDPGTTSRSEFGLTFKAGYNKKNIIENVDVSTLLTIFGNYERLEHLDVNWEGISNFKINKFLAASYSILLVYDDDVDVVRNDETVGPALQIKQALNIGLTVSF